MTCDSCDIGYGGDGSSCSECQSPNYNNAVSSISTACAPGSCPQGQGYTWQSSSSFQCASCPAGQYSDSATTGQCTACASGLYQEQSGQSSCKYCLAGTEFTSTTTVCTACSTGTYQSSNTQSSAECSQCGSGTFYVDKETSCSSCPSGSYQDLTAHSETVCKSCNAGFFTSALDRRHARLVKTASTKTRLVKPHANFAQRVTNTS